MLLRDPQNRWKKYTDSRHSFIFTYQQDVERFAEAQTGLWIVCSIHGPYHTHYWRASRIRPEYESQVEKEAQLIRYNPPTPLRKQSIQSMDLF
ncbi:hypothetical protein [Desmospora activa]|uniref:Uncharacterized protein n=1 Tax=Desmospora activa DSM 45169 TaxID=1121389 RepID=A0A2T4ZCQ8_9BACL|nr:hypothetical protein [Desmospora activa]PTM59671.1 hypothetical protein C8J48_2301 [Desmospora activa DSM 45169]